MISTTVKEDNFKIFPRHSKARYSACIATLSLQPQGVYALVEQLSISRIFPLRYTPIYEYSTSIGHDERVDTTSDTNFVLADQPSIRPTPFTITVFVSSHEAFSLVLQKVLRRVLHAVSRLNIVEN